MLGLVVATILAASALGSVSTVLSLPAPAPITRLATPENGTLLMDLLLGIRPYNNFTPLDLPAYFRPLSFESVSVTRIDQPALNLTFKTNFAGLLRVQLPVSDQYQVEVNDTRFHAVVPFSIQKDGQTNLIIRANRNALLATFQESEDSFSSGWVTPTSRIFLKAFSAEPLSTNSGPIFLETERVTGIPRTSFNLTADRSISQTPLKLTSQEVRRSQLWMDISPLRPINLSGLARLYVVTYTPSFTVTFGTNLS